jgi:hypothetical protein
MSEDSGARQQTRFLLVSATWLAEFFLLFNQIYIFTKIKKWNEMQLPQRLEWSAFYVDGERYSKTYAEDI